MLISTQPLSLSAGVKHVGPDDELSSTAITRATMQLEAQNYALLAKLNELIGELTNVSMPVPIVLPKLSLPALATEWVGNFCVPAGYQATVLSASISTSPVAGQASLEITHSAGTFGSNGTSAVGTTKLVTTVGSYSADGTYVGEGELVFKITSSATKRIEAVASVLLSIKPPSA